MYDVGSLRIRYARGCKLAPHERKFTSAKGEVEASLLAHFRLAKSPMALRTIRTTYPCKLRERLKLICCRNVRLHWSAITINNRDPSQSIFAVADVEDYMIRRLCALERYECNSMHR
jgi:hypothetical protein